VDAWTGDPLAAGAVDPGLEAGTLEALTTPAGPRREQAVAAQVRPVARNGPTGASGARQAVAPVVQAGGAPPPAAPVAPGKPEVPPAAEPEPSTAPGPVVEPKPDTKPEPTTPPAADDPAPVTQPKPEPKPEPGPDPGPKPDEQPPAPPEPVTPPAGSGTGEATGA
jgi:protein TonB